MYKLVSFDVCPYVQRNIIVLEEKNIPYEIEYIDINNPPSWFIKISPLGKVPILITENSVIFESSIINEFLDETTSDRKLQPETPLRRAQNRSWIDFISTILVTRNKLQHSKTEQQTRKFATIVHQQLMHLEEQITVGPFFNGDDFSLIDAAAAPLFQRLNWILELVPDLGLLDGLTKVSAWSEALLHRKSTRHSTIEDIRTRYLDYLRGNGCIGDDNGPSWISVIGESQENN